MNHRMTKHPNMVRLGQILGSSIVAIGTMELLWHFACDNARDGNLAKFTASDIARIVDWTGEPDEFIAHLVASGWLERVDDDHLMLVDFEFVLGWWDEVHKS